MSVARRCPRGGRTARIFSKSSPSNPHREGPGRGRRKPFVHAWHECSRPQPRDRHCLAGRQSPALHWPPLRCAVCFTYNSPNIFPKHCSCRMRRRCASSIPPVRSRRSRPITCSLPLRSGKAGRTAVSSWAMSRRRPGLCRSALEHLFAGTPDALERVRLLVRLRPKAVLAPRLIPLLVRFRDIRDPKLVELVDAADLAAAFGSGVALRRATIEITRDPVTTGIETRLPWLPQLGGRCQDGRVVMPAGRSGGGGPEAIYYLSQRVAESAGRC